ncbi:helix-turn-helix domain-containing protein [Pseudonocardia endophytica]|uniref:Sigma-70-like protein n=1 Tax=Pseudonocardia endophytica TaxID=401976 RepID=A0A4R1HVP0_PSEEN|nr:helix-turn-helix domain containing protein [Pseudonocardia endophytica]TCK21562.1 hypothetical protein EV378_5550 [Pseudonocardia endophytica]
MAQPPDDAAVEALNALVDQLMRTRAELGQAVERAHELVALRNSGHTWVEIVRAEQRPLIIERISQALDDLGVAGSRFRREEALALAREDVSITDISKMFGVSRQRVSTLVQEQAVPPA